MNTDRRTSIRLPATPTYVKAKLQVGRDIFNAQLVDESMAGFALIVEVPRRKLGENGFTSETDCHLFGEIARLSIQGGSQYEVQIISIVPREEESSSATRSRISLRMGTRVVREVYAEARNSFGRNVRLVSAIAIALLLSAYCTTSTYFGHVGDWLPQAQTALAGLADLVNQDNSGAPNWKQEIAHASANGYVVPGTPAMQNLMAVSKAQPALHRVQRVVLFQQDNPFLEQMNLTPHQLLEVRKIALETSAQMERLWKQMQNNQALFEQELAKMLEIAETRILANLTQAQAEAWVNVQFG